MSKVYLISERTLKGFVVAENLDSAYLNPAISEAQDIHLQQIIGTKLLNKIEDLVADGSIQNENAYKLLLDEYITPYLQYKTVASLVIPLAYKERNAGVVQTNNEYVYNTGLKDANFLRGYYSDKADFYSIRLTNYIQANSSDYPEYFNSCACSGDVIASKSTDCQIYLG